ncbi:MAG: acetylornithine deacetylase, partial [Xanthobacteraceae bacterium]
MADDRSERIRKLLADLVGINTVSDRSNLGLIAYIEKYLASFGISGSR